MPGDHCSGPLIFECWNEKGDFKDACFDCLRSNWFGFHAFRLRGERSESRGSAHDPYKVYVMQEGSWDAEVSLITPGNEDKPDVSKGVEINKMIGGKWLISSFKAELFGMPFEGSGQNGYDPKKGKYIGAWVDSMSNQIAMMEGEYDEKTKTLTMATEFENPGTGKAMKMKIVNEFKNDGTRVMKQYVKEEGAKDFVKMMDVKYTKLPK